MATITSSSLNELLKRLYAPWEIMQLVNLTHPVLASCARKGSAQLGGSGFYFAVRNQAAEGHAYISEDDDLPAGQQSEVIQLTFSPKVQAGVVQLTGLSMSVSSGDAMAFARGFDENVQSTIQAMSAYKEGAFFRDGSGLITAFNGAVATSAGPHTCDDVGHLREGMFVDIIDQGDNTRHNEDLEIAEVDWVNKTVTFASAVDAAVDDNDELYLAGSQAASGAPVAKEPTGVESSLLNTGSYGGKSRSTYPNLKTPQQAVNGFLDENQLLRARTRLTQESGVGLSQFGAYKLVCHPMQADVLFKLAIPRIQYAAGGSFDLGNKSAPSFGGIMLETSYQAPTTKAYLGDWQHSQTLYAPNGELHIDTEYNGSALKWVATKDVGLVFVKEYCEFVVKKANAFIRLTGLTEQSR